MPRGRPPKNQPPAPPPDEVDDEEQAEEEQDDEDTGDQEDADEPRPAASKHSALDEPVGSPGTTAPPTMQFQPGFGGAQRPNIPPLDKMPWMVNPGRPAQPIASQAAAPASAHPSSSAEPYSAEDADPIQSEVQEQSDGALSRAFLSQFPGDMRVDVEVWQCDGAQNIPRGRLENIMLSYARVPTRYIPYGGLGGSGQWQLEYYSSMTGKILARRRVSLPGDEPPENYRVENVVAEQEAMKALMRMLAGGGTPGAPGIPPAAYADEKAWLRQQIEDQKKTLDQMRMDFERRDREAERQRFEDRIRQLEGGGGGQNQQLAMIQAIGALYAPMLQNRGNDDRLVDIVLQMNGPSMMQAQAAMYNEILSAATKMGGLGGDGEDGSWKKMIGGALKGAVEKYMDQQGKRQEAHDKFLRDREAKKEREAAARSGQQPAASPVAQPAAAAAEPANGQSTERKMFALMIKDFRTAMEMVGKADVPADQKPTSDEVSTKLVLFFRTAIELRLHKTHPDIDQMTSDILTNPEGFMAQFCAAYGAPAQFGAEVATQFRQKANLPPVQAPAPASPAPPPPPAEQPQAAPAATVKTTATIRLPGTPPSRPPAAPAEAAPFRHAASASAVEPPSCEQIVEEAKHAVEDDISMKVAEATTKRKRSPKVERKDAEVGQVAEPQGPVHVVDAGAQAPAGEGVQEGDAKPEGGQAAKQDGGGLVDALHPGGEVEKPPVPQAPGVVVEPKAT